MASHPVPHPPQRPPQTAPATEFAHIAQARRGDRAAVFVGRRSHGTVTVHKAWEGPHADSNNAVIDAFLHLVAEAQTLTEQLTIIPSSRLFRDLALIDFHDPHVHIGTGTERPYLSETHQLTKQWLQEQRQAEPVPLTVATDAAVAARHRTAGIAVVAEDGRTMSRSFTGRSNVIRCELEAIALAIETFRGPLRILTDSVAAIHLLSIAPGQAPSHYRQLLRRIARLRGERVRVEWVRGHDGHALNEAADGLAVRARRQADLERTPDPAAASNATWWPLAG